MAETSYPLPPSRVITDAEFEKLTHPMATDGIVGDPTDSTVIFGDSSGMQVKIRADKLAHLRGFAWESGSTVTTKSISANASGQTRVDLVVLRLTRSTWVVAVAVVAGTPGAGAPSATRDLGSTGVYEIELATVTVTNGAATITSGNVVNKAWNVGEPPVLCTSDTRPPHAKGRRIWETDTSREYVSTGSTWVLTYEDAGKTNLTAASGWSVGSYGAFVRRKSGFVTLYAQFNRTGSTLSSGVSTLSTLPVGYRPQERMSCFGYLQGSSPANINMETSGVLQLVSYIEPSANGDYIFITPVTFQVA